MIKTSTRSKKVETKKSPTDEELLKMLKQIDRGIAASLFIVPIVMKMAADGDKTARAILRMAWNDQQHAAWQAQLKRMLGGI